MIGKKNIVFGFLYLALTAALGPVMIINHMPVDAAANDAKKQKMSFLKQAVGDNFMNPETLENMTPKQIGETNAKTIIALSDYVTGPARTRIDNIKGGPHSHGNLEAVLNILVGFLLCFLAVHKNFKQAISWIFIAGALLHSGLLYLAVGLELEFAAGLLGGWVSYIGPSLILIGLVLAGVAAFLGFRPQPVYD